MKILSGQAPAVSLSLSTQILALDFLQNLEFFFFFLQGIQQLEVLLKVYDIPGILQEPLQGNSSFFYFYFLSSSAAPQVWEWGAPILISHLLLNLFIAPD